MSRYIDTKWLENNAKEYSLGYYESDEWATPLSALDEAPSIEIIRCRECRWYGNEQKKIYESCTYWAQNGGTLVPMKLNDFCSNGERSE